MDNMEIYNKYKTVPENALKDFDNGKFKGTDINTMWRIKCLTEQFGACGIGWVWTPLEFWTVNGANDEVMVFCKGQLKYAINRKTTFDNGEVISYEVIWSEPIIAIGGNKMIKFVRKNDCWENSDEAYKMANTDAFGVACKYLGIGADIYWANDNSKYTNDKEEPKEDTKKTEKPKTNTKDTKKMTLEQAKEVTWVGKGDVNYRLGDLPKDQLLMLKDYTKLPKILEAVDIILADIEKNENRS